MECHKNLSLMKCGRSAASDGNLAILEANFQVCQRRQVPFLPRKDDNQAVAGSDFILHVIAKIGSVSILAEGAAA